VKRKKNVWGDGQDWLQKPATIRAKTNGGGVGQLVGEKQQTGGPIRGPSKAQTKSVKSRGRSEGDCWEKVMKINGNEKTHAGNHGEGAPTRKKQEHFPGRVEAKPRTQKLGKTD